MTPTSSSLREAIAPLWRDNMALAQLLGLCPLLAVTTTLVNGLALGLASAAVVVIASTTMAAKYTKNCERGILASGIIVNAPS